MGVNVETGVSIHNVMRVVARNAETMEIEEEGIAYNIVLDRAWDRICNFNSYFDHIVFGKGDGTPIASRSTLFSRVGSKPAIQESLVRDYPTSVWTKTCRLGTEEFNGNILTEIGISNETTNINTHAMIADSEGNPLSVEKTNLRIIDLYATVFVNVYDVDSGLFFYGNGLRDYLTGSGAPGNTLGISNLEVASVATIDGSKVVSVAEKMVTLSGRFNVGDLNKDVKCLYWTGIGLTCKVPRPGLFEGKQISGASIGVGDGVKKDFHLGRSPNTPIENLAVFVDGVSVNFTYNKLNNIVTLENVPANGVPVTANYKSLYFPKTVDNVLDVVFKIKFEGSIPTPVVPPESSVIPGETVPIAGDTNYGFFGEVFPDDLINGEYLATKLGLTSGSIQNTGENWLKFALDGKTLFVAKKTLRHSISWDQINAVNAIFGDRTIEIKGHTYKIRLLKTGLVDPMSSSSGAVLHGSEWNKLMLPIHIKAKDKSWAYANNVETGLPYWGIDYTDEDLMTHYSFGNGSYSWCQETYSSSRLTRGGLGVSSSDINSSSITLSYYGWRPVLELVA